jgi:uncharacterized protein YeaO (DUF488 family)
MPVKTKRWNDPTDPDDGFRLLICRYRPRGLPKGEETWDAWNAQLGPSKELLADFHGKGRLKTSWAEYRARYLREMRGQKPAIDDLARRVAAGETITLLCSAACEREARCHRSLLRELIQRAMATPDARVDGQ